MSEPRAVVVMGVSGSGKSTIGSLVAQRLEWSFFDADDLHPAGNVAKMSAGEPLTDDDRIPWLRALSDLMASSLGRGESMVLACSALKADFRDRLLEGNGAMLVYLKGDRQLIETRMHTRSGHFMSAAMLDSQFVALEEPDGALALDITRDPDAIVDSIVEAIQADAASP